MASSALRNDQQIKQPSVPKTTDSMGGTQVINTQLGTGSGKVINGISKAGKK